MCSNNWWGGCQIQIGFLKWDWQLCPVYLKENKLALEEESIVSQHTIWRAWLFIVADNIYSQMTNAFLIICDRWIKLDKVYFLKSYKCLFPESLQMQNNA